MNTNRLGFLVFVLLLMFTSPNILCISSLPSCHEEIQQSKNSYGNYQQHKPITISNDSDFASQGWPGHGTEEDSYVIKNLNITDSSVCISITNTTVYFEIRECVISSEYASKREGIVLDNVRNGRIIDCSVSMHYYGTRLFASPSARLINNKAILNGDAGFYIASSNGCRFIGNIATNNYGDGFHISNSDNCSFVNSSALHNSNALYPPNGFHIFSSDNCSFVNNTVSNNSGDGFSLVSSDDAFLTNNTSSSNSGSGFRLSYSQNSNVKRNKAIGQREGYGIHLYASNNGTLSTNIAFQNRIGFCFEYSQTNELTGNHASNNIEAGIGVFGSDFCKLAMNRVTNNMQYGVLISNLSNSNMLYLNSLGYNALENGYDNGSLNSWFSIGSCKA